MRIVRLATAGLLLASTFAFDGTVARGEPGSYLDPVYREIVIALRLETDPETLLESALNATDLNETGKEQIRSILNGSEEREEFVEMIDNQDQFTWIQSQCYYSITGEFPRGQRVDLPSPPGYTSAVFQNLGSIASQDRDLPVYRSGLSNEHFELALRGLIEPFESEEIEELRTIVRDFHVEENCDAHEDFEFLYAAYVNQTNDFDKITGLLSSNDSILRCFRLRAMRVLLGSSLENTHARDVVLDLGRAFAHSPEFREFRDRTPLLHMLYVRRNDPAVTHFIITELIGNNELGPGRLYRSTGALLTVLRDSSVVSYGTDGIIRPIDSAEHSLRAKGLEVRDEYKVRHDVLHYAARE